MRALLVACLFLVGCSPCQRYCLDQEEGMAALMPTVLTADQAVAMDWMRDGELDSASYRSMCRSAPAATDCQGCASWFYDAFLASVEVAPDCYVHYFEGSAPEAAENCQRQCTTAGLATYSTNGVTTVDDPGE